MSGAHAREHLMIERRSKEATTHLQLRSGSATSKSMEVLRA